MIIKSMSRKNDIGKTISYLFKDEAKLKGEGYKPITIRKNIRSRKLENVVKEFKANESLRKQKRTDAVKLYHTVLAFHQKDSQYLNEKALKDFTKEYMKQRGDNMYIATAHFNTASIHIHICESGSGYMTCKANRLSKQQFRELKVAMQTFQQTKYPKLTNSLPRHQKEISISNRQSQKQSLLDCLKQAEGHSKNLTEFLNHIQEFGHQPYYRGDKLAGIKYDGDTKFRFSNLGYKEKVEELNQRFNEEQQQLQELEDLRSNSVSKEQEQESKERLTEEENDNQNETEIKDEDDYSR